MQIDVDVSPRIQLQVAYEGFSAECAFCCTHGTWGVIGKKIRVGSMLSLTQMFLASCFQAASTLKYILIMAQRI